MSSGEKQSIEGLQRQLAELQRENARLRQDNDLLQVVLDSIPDMIGIQHPDHTMLCYNKAGYDFLGLRPDEVRGKKCFELIGRTRQCDPCATSAMFSRSVSIPLIPDRLSGDKTRLTQILFNLVGNASKYTRQGMVEVEATVLPPRNPGECRLLFAVQDSGMGISDHLLEQVFEPFAQGSESDSPYSRQYEGAGLGLPLVKRLVRLMHGSLSIDSRKGEGTTVYVSLPFDLSEGDEQRLEHKLP